VRGLAAEAGIPSLIAPPAGAVNPGHSPCHPPLNQALLSNELAAEFGRGFAEKSLRRMTQFAEVFPDQQIVAALSRQLGWSHFVEIIPLKDDLERDFYKAYGHTIPP
jgi:hypothetical protein